MPTDSIVQVSNESSVLWSDLFHRAKSQVSKAGEVIGPCDRAVILLNRQDVSVHHVVAQIIISMLID